MGLTGDYMTAPRYSAGNVDDAGVFLHHSVYCADLVSFLVSAVRTWRRPAAGTCVSPGPANYDEHDVIATAIVPGGQPSRLFDVAIVNDASIVYRSDKAV